MLQCTLFLSPSLSVPPFPSLSQITSLEKELQEHLAYKPRGKHTKHVQLQDWFDKFEFLQFEVSIQNRNLIGGSVADSTLTLQWQ